MRSDPGSVGFLPAFPGLACQMDQILSIMAWCIQKIGSAGAVGMLDIVPLSHMWTRLWGRSSKSVVKPV